MKKRILLLCFLVCCCVTTLFSANKWKEYTYKTFAARTFDGWPAMLTSFERTALAGTADEQVELLVYYYGYIGHLMDYDKKSEASTWNKRAMKLLKTIKKGKEQDARIIALESMFIAYDIAITPLKATYQVPSMMSTAKQALKLNNNCFLAQQAQANILFYFPETLGGDKQKAIVYYKKVYQYFKTHPQISASDWMYLNVLSTLGVAYEKIGNLKMAQQWALLALQVEPDFRYVRTILLPRIEKKL